MRTIDAIILRLEQQNVGISGSTIFVGSDASLPDIDTAFLSISETAGRPPIGVHNPNSKSLRQPGYQIVSRAAEYQPAGELIELALAALGGEEGLSNILIGDIFFLTIRPSSDILGLPPDARDRVRLAFNVNSVRR